MCTLNYFYACILSFAEEFVSGQTGSSRCMVKGTEYKLKCRKFHLSIGEITFNVKVVRCWSRLPKEAVKCPCLDILKKQMEHGPEKPAPAEPPWSKGVELDHFQKCLLTSALTVVLSIVKHLALSI